MQAAELPPEAPPDEPIDIEKPDPVATAASSAIKDRPREMERAAAITQEAASQAQRFATERPQQDPIETALVQMPERVQRWYRDHPEFLNDPERAAQVQYCHFVAKRETGQEGTDLYFDRMEHLLGLRSNGGAVSPQPTPAPRSAAPVRQPQYSGAPMAAPPSRSTPSMTTGRPAGETPRLTREEIYIALQSKTHPEEADETAIRRYAQQKAKMIQLKAAGVLQDGR